MAHWTVFVGMYTKEWSWSRPLGTPALGIECFRFDDSNGSLTDLETTAGLLSPQYLAVHPRLAILYAAEDASPGFLVGLARAGSGGNWPAHISVHPSGHHAYVVNYRSGNLAAFRIDELGRALKTRDIIGSSDLKGVRGPRLDAGVRATWPNGIETRGSSRA